MIVVGDTTAITTLLKTGDDGLLGKLFGIVLVPPAVWNELHAFHSSLPGFIEMRSLSSWTKWAGTENPGHGEIEAMQLHSILRQIGFWLMTGKPASLPQNRESAVWR